MKWKFSLLLVVLAGVLSAAELQGLLTPEPGTFWTRGARDLMTQSGVRFAWGSNDRKLMRYSAPRGGGGTLQWLGQNVCEVLCTLKTPEGQLQSMTISVYNRGDAGPMPDRQFKLLREKAEAAVSKLAGEAVVPVRERMSMARQTVFSRIWTAQEVRWQLLWCESDRGPEYLTLKANPASEPVEKLRQSVKADVGRKNLPALVEKDSDGSLYLPVPMIDQGAKGYCAAATMARVIRYYGSDIDQNQAAQIIGTDAQFGTSCREMLKKLEQEKTMLNVRTRMLYEWQDFATINDIRKFISRYNRAARSARKSAIRLEDHIKVQGKQRILDMNSLNKALDQDVCRQMRLADRDVVKFRKEVHEAIRRGLPVLWMIPGHIRLIVGMDPKEDQIFYSDSWGQGHEKKKMPVQEAFIITHRIFVLEPR